MSIPDAVLSAFVEARGAREATRAIQGVQDQLKEATKDAVEATNAVNRFGRVRGIAVLDVDAAKARAQTSAATKDLQQFNGQHATAVADVDAQAARHTVADATRDIDAFGHEHAAALLEANGNGVTREVAKASSEVEAFGHEHATATLDADTSRVAAMTAEVRKSGHEVQGLAKDFDGLHSSKSETDKLIDRNVGTFGSLASSIGGASASSVSLRGSLGPLSGGLGVVASAALFFGIALLSVLGPTVAVVAALAPLVGLAAGAAGGLAAAAQGFGVFKLATLGVGAALKEQIKLSTASGGQALQQAGQEQAAARAISAALESVRSAREGVRRASETLSNAERQEHQAIAALPAAYEDARRHIQDLSAAVTDSAISLKEARLRATEARAALADLLNGPSPRELADAHRAVSDALRGETSAVRELTTSQTALNDLLKPPDVLDVADAQDAVADSLRDQTHAANDLADQLAATNAVLNDPSSTADAKARAQLALADAQNAVGDAARRTEHAQRALDALQAPPSADAVAAAQGRVADAQAGVEKATLATRDAQDALVKVQAGAASSDIAKARLDLAAAQQTVSKATLESARAAADYRAAEAAGVAGAPSVVAARDAVRAATSAAANADRGLTDAEHQLALAQQGVRDAQTDAARATGVMAATSVDANRKLNALPPSAQAFVRELIAMKAKADELRQTAAAGFFPGAQAGLVAAANNFEPVRRVVAATASVLGDLSRRAGELVGGVAFGRDIETIGTRNARVLDTLGQATLHVVSALRHVLVAAGPLTQWLADVADKWALNAAESAKAGRESGKLADFFDHAREVAQRLGSILGHLAHGLFGIGKAGSDSGNEILASIDRASKRFDTWANSVGGQNQIREFFEKTREIAAALVPAIANLAKGFGFLALRMLPVTDALRLLGPYADEAVVAFVAYKLAITGVTVAANAWKVAAAVAAFATGGWTTAFWALNAALAANPIGLVVVAIAALVAGLVIAYKQSKTFRDIVDGAFHGAADAFNWLLGAAQDVFGWLGSHWPLLLAILTGPIGLAVLAIHSHADDIVSFFTALPGRIADAIKGGASAFAGAVTWIKDQIVGGIQAYLSFYVTVGSWVVNRIVDGVKVMASAIADAAGWVKNRVVEGLHATVDAFVALGGWIVNRIVDGIKVIGDALASVGGWLKNRIVELIQLAVDGFIGVGGWILNRIVDGFKTVTDGLASVGGWLKNRVGDAFDAAKDGFVGLGGTIIGWIVDGLKSGANLLIDFLNDIVHVINKLPGVDIADIKHLAEGGQHGGSAASQAKSLVGLARGGAFARTGGVIGAPITMMGEEAPRHPEFVIPTNPAYRDRAQMLLVQAAGAIGLAEGGVVSAFKGAIQQTGAGEKPSLALFEAGIVESGLRNLPYGDADSLGSLQLRASLHGRDLAMDPLRSALAFLTRGFTGRGGAIELAQHLGTAGQVAQAVQGSRFPDRYDQVRAQALDYLGGDDGGILGAIKGAVGAVGGVLGDLLSKGAGFLLDQLPGVGDLPDWLKGTGKYVLSNVGDWIKDKVSGLVGANDSGAQGAPGGGGLGSFDGLQVANWIIPILNWARSHGWHGHITSGYRSHATNVAQGRNYHSNHEDTAYPGGAVDVGGYGARKEGQALASVLAGYDGARRLVWGGPVIDDWGHFSATGHKTGGVWGGMLGSYENGTDYVPQTGPYLLHRGESVTPAAGNQPMVLHVYLGDREIRDVVRVEIEQDGRRSAQAWNAGVSQ